MLTADEMIRRVDPGYAPQTAAPAPYALSAVEAPVVAPAMLHPQSDSVELPPPLASTPVLIGQKEGRRGKGIGELTVGELADLALRDPAFIGGVRQLIVESGLAEMLGLTYVPPPEEPQRYVECPTDWTALQVGLFDNGNVRTSDGRGRKLASRAKWAISLKVWNSNDPDFKRPCQWSASAPLWSGEFAIEHAAKLRRARTITEETAECLALIAQHLSNGDLVGIPSRKRIGSGTRYFEDIFVVLMFRDGPPKAMLHFMGKQIDIEAWTDRDPLGRKLKLPEGCASVVGGRVTRGIDIPMWSTQSVESPVC